MPPLSDCVPYGIYVALAVSSLGQEVEHRPIMPDMIGLSRQICLCNIGFNPIYIFARAPSRWRATSSAVPETSRTLIC